MSSKIEVHKVELVDGEELMQMVDKVIAAVTQSKGKLKKSLSLRGIFKDHVVVRDAESGKMFRMKMTRDDKGQVALEGMEEVKQVFVPVKQKADGAGDHTCVCASCGYTEQAKIGEECRAKTCPKCGAKMTKAPAKSGDKDEDKDKKGKTEKSDTPAVTLVAVDGDVVETPLSPPEILTLLKSASDEQGEMVEVKVEKSDSMWAGVI